MLRILFAGEGGQGVQSAAQILAQAVFEKNQKVLYIPNFGVEQRGGVSLAFLVIDPKRVVFPKFSTADVLVIFSDRSVKRVENYADQNTKLVLTGAVNKPLKLPGKKFWISNQYSHQVWNVCALAMVAKITGLVGRNDLKKAMEKRFGRAFKQNPRLRKLDFEALESILDN